MQTTQEAESQENIQKPPKLLSAVKFWLRWVTVGLAALFVLALAVQLVRGKLWIVGSAGVWALLVATLVAALATAFLEKPQGVTATASRISSKLTTYGVIVAILTLIGLWLRIWGQKNGLPYILNSDESVTVDAGTRILKTGNFDPYLYSYPGFYIYLQLIVAGIQFLWGSFTGLYSSIKDLPDRTFAITTAPEVYIWGRTFAALVGATAIPLAYVVVKRVWADRRAGLIAAGFVTFSTLTTEHSHYISVDMPMAILSLLALWPAFNIVEKGRYRDYILAGVVAGLATGTKWSAVVILAMLIVGHLLRRVKIKPFNLRVPTFSISLVAYALAVLATTPFLFAKIKEYSDIFIVQLVKYQVTDALQSVKDPWLGNLGVIWNDSPWLFLLGVGGVLLLALRRKPADWLALSFPLLYLLNMNGYHLIYPRNVLPLTLYFAVFGALLVVWAFDWLRERLPQIKLEQRASWALSVGLPVLVIVTVMFGSFTSILYGDNFNDSLFSYARAEAWLKKEVGPGPLKLVEMRSQQWGSYPNLIARTEDQGANDFSLQYYRERGIQFVAINLDRAAGERMSGSYKELLQPSLIVQDIKTKAIEQPGPAFSIIRTGVTPETLKLNYSPPGEFGGKLRLLGLNVGKVDTPNLLYLPPQGEARPKESWSTFKAGETMGLSFYWQVLAPLGQDYTIFIHLNPAAQPEVNAASRDTQPLLGAYPTSQWKTGEIITDNPNVTLPASLAPGDYNVVMGFYLNDGKFTPLPLANGASSLTLGQIKVTK